MAVRQDKGLREAMEELGLCLSQPSLLMGERQVAGCPAATAPAGYSYTRALVCLSIESCRNPTASRLAQPPCLLRDTPLLGPFSRAMPRALRWCYECTSPTRNCPHPMTTVGT